MATTLITNIKQLVNTRTANTLLLGKELAELPCTDNAWMIVEDGIIASFGPMASLDKWEDEFDQSVDASGQLVLPCWCDSHTHLVFAASREEEFVDKIKGMSYADIAAKGGGILNSARKTAAATESELFNAARLRLQELMQLGTGAIEIKSGYGLDTATELKMLRVIRKLKEISPIPIRATFLGAHTYPIAYRDDHEGYINELINDMLPVIAEEQLADYIDVFCETGFFSPNEMDKICRAGMEIGLKPKIHVNQLNSIGCIETGIDLGAVSMDHLETMTEKDIALISGQQATAAGNYYKGIGTVLPTAAFFLRMPYQPARAMIDAGAAIALASDYNPGSSPSGNMNFVAALSCIQLKMLPEEAINAATINGAYAMELQDEVGSIMIGKRANLIFTKAVPSLAYLPYAFGSNLIDKVMISGEWI